MKNRFVAVMIDGITHTHLPHPNGEYATLCGVDGDDPTLKQFPAKPGSKITCRDCWSIFETCLQFRTSDFADIAQPF